MPNAIVMHESGGPELMQWQEWSVGAPKAGEVQIRQTVVGVNYIDVYQRKGIYPCDLPGSIGMEAVGVVEAVGEGVDTVAAGDRVGYVMGQPGAYCEVRNYPAERLIPLPDDISDEQAAAMLLKGLTAAYLVKRTFVVSAGHRVLVQAAAGGVGLILCQWLQQLGATVIGTVGSDEKAEIAKRFGCEYPIVYTRDDFAKQVAEITNGEGVNCVYDGVGAATYEGTLASLARFGMFVSFGAASGAPPAVPAKALAGQALYFTRPGLGPHTATRELTLQIAEYLFDAVRAGVTININQRWALSEAADAHRALENRETTGSTVLTI